MRDLSVFKRNVKRSVCSSFMLSRGTSPPAAPQTARASHFGCARRHQTLRRLGQLHRGRNRAQHFGNSSEDVPDPMVEGKVAGSAQKARFTHRTAREVAPDTALGRSWQALNEFAASHGSTSRGRQGLSHFDSEVKAYLA